MKLISLALAAALVVPALAFAKETKTFTLNGLTPTTNKAALEKAISTATHGQATISGTTLSVTAPKVDEAAIAKALPKGVTTGTAAGTTTTTTTTTTPAAPATPTHAPEHGTSAPANPTEAPTTK